LFFSDIIIRIFFSFFKPNVHVIKSHTCGSCSSLKNELSTFTCNICHDYIHFWYKDISSSSEFVTDCDTAIQTILNNLFSYLCLLDKRSLIVNMLKRFSTFSCNYNSDLTFLTNEDESILIKSLLDKLLTLIAPDWLQKFSSSNEVKEKNNLDLVYLMIRDLLTNAAFLPIIEIITDPNWLNMVILNYLEPSVEYQYQFESLINQYEYKEPLTTSKSNFTNLKSKHNLSLISLPSSSSRYVLDHKRSISEVGSPLKETLFTEGKFVTNFYIIIKNFAIELKLLRISFRYN